MSSTEKLKSEHIVGIVGSEQAKFTPATEAMARERIEIILRTTGATTVCSGHCHLGGVDIFAEEIADKLGLKKLIFAPKELSWSKGYKPRNVMIANASHEIYCITVKELPPGYVGMRFPLCYHCGTKDHVKSGRVLDSQDGTARREARHRDRDLESILVVRTETRCPNG